VLPLKTVVIPAKNDGINFDGDLNADGISDNDQEKDEDGNIKIENNKITVNGSTIEYNSDDKDSIIVNGKKVPKKEADKFMDSIKQNIKKMKGANINFKLDEDKNEISIQTK